MKFEIILFIILFNFVYSKNNCKKSITSVNGKKIDCKNKLIFEDNFNRVDDDEEDVNHFGDDYYYLNTSIWKREIKIPVQPDYEFCVYHKLEKSLKLEENLKIIPTLLDDSYGENITNFGRLQLADCTGVLPGECQREAMAFSILPPVISSRLTTKDRFSFRYGKIEIRARFPEGDWLYPEMYLDPKYTSYGSGYSSGRVILGLARGNENLMGIDRNEDFSSRVLEFGLRTGSSDNVTEDKVTKKSDLTPWTEDYHTYTTIWKTTGFTFLVEGEVVGQLDLKDEFGEVKLAPYDLEFYLVLGVGVGGVRVFPDNLRSNYNEKPWKNVGAKAMLRFWQAKDQWLPSWLRKNSQKRSLEVNYVRVWSI